jgi:hypothetical protein
MKRIIFAFCIMLITASCASLPKANPDEVSLNTAIRQAAAQIESGLDKGTKIALVNFTSPSQAFSEYVLDELSSVLVNNKYLVVVDRANLDKIRQELGFNMSGEVSDKSMQEIGQMLGAQALATGSLTSIADLRRVMFKVIITETAAVAVQHNADIINDRRVQALLAQGGGSKAVAYGNANYSNANTRANTASGSGTSGNTTPTPIQVTPAQPATPTYPRSGTYTFYPRLQAYRGATRERAYLWKVTVRGEFMDVYITGVATGDATRTETGNWRGAGEVSSQAVILQDLDNPSLSWNPSGGRLSGYSWGNDQGAWYSFRGVTATRFSLTNNSNRATPAIFEEINLANAQYEP